MHCKRHLDPCKFMTCCHRLPPAGCTSATEIESRSIQFWNLLDLVRSSMWSRERTMKNRCSTSHRKVPLSEDSFREPDVRLVSSTQFHHSRPQVIVLLAIVDCWVLTLLASIVQRFSHRRLPILPVGATRFFPEVDTPQPNSCSIACMDDTCSDCGRHESLHIFTYHCSGGSCKHRKASNRGSLFESCSCFAL